MTSANHDLSSTPSLETRGSIGPSSLTNESDRRMQAEPIYNYTIYYYLDIALERPTTSIPDGPVLARPLPRPNHRRVIWMHPSTRRSSDPENGLSPWATMSCNHCSVWRTGRYLSCPVNVCMVIQGPDFASFVDLLQKVVL